MHAANIVQKIAHKHKPLERPYDTWCVGDQSKFSLGRNNGWAKKENRLPPTLSAFRAYIVTLCCYSNTLFALVQAVEFTL